MNKANIVEKPELKDGHYQIKFPNGKLQEEYFVKNGERDGFYREWYENGQLENETHFVRGLLSGRMRLWEQDGMLMSQQYFLAGRPTSKKKYLEECARNPELPRYAEEKITNTLGNYVRRLKREKRQQAKLGPTPEQIENQKWFDQECQSEVKKKTSKEALAWLTKKVEGERELSELSVGEASRFVRKLYSLGAKKVWAINIEADVDGDQYSKELVVKLPREKARQGNIYNACTDAARPTLSGATAIRMGMNYMGISLL